MDILGGQAVQAAGLISRLRELPFLNVGFLPINPRLPGPLRNLQAIKYLRTIVTSLLYVATLLMRVPQFDVIHIFSASYFSFILAPTPAILIAKLFGKKVLLNYHSGEAEDHLTRWESAVSTIQLADEVVVPSEYLVRVFKQFGIRAHAINNLIELDRFVFSERNPLRPVFLSNRNLETHYGVDRVLHAFALIQATFPEAKLNIVGDGSQRVALETLMIDLGLRNTKFIGRTQHDGIVEQYQAADIYLNGSEIDNQPLSILEAFACGLPVVTTNPGGIPDMVTNGKTGFVVGQSDYQAMADCAVLLLKNSPLSNAMARRAREECEKYSWRAVRKQWTKRYFQLARESSRNRLQSETRMSKLGKMSVDELRVRSSQALSTFAERRGWSSLARLPSDRALFKLLDPSPGANARNSTHDLLEWFRTRDIPNFFAAFTDPQATLAELRSRWPEAEKQIVDQADRIVTGRLDLLGYKNLRFSDPIHWHLEPISGKSAPPVHWSRLNYLDADVVGDKKIIWELNRQQYFVTMGQAYWLSGNEKYADTFVAHLNSWMDANPPKVGINWASSLEIALRTISWLWALYFFRNSAALTPATLVRVLKFLYLNARHLETYLSTYFSPNTHLTGEALGLFYLGTLLPEFREAAAWRAKGREILIEQLAQQVKADGVYFEQSSYYHRYTVDFYTHLLILSRVNGDPINSDLEKKLTALLDHLMYVTRPDGTTPLFGDEDGGRLVRLDRRATNDFRAALANGVALFGRSDYKFVAGELAEETLWLLGPQGLQQFDQIEAKEPTQESKNFPDGGYYVMRDGWHDKANYLFFDCGPHGTGNCGHAHADALAIEVAANGQPLLVDPGTCTYTGSREQRDWFRGSNAHNVLVVDGEPSSVSAGPFSWERVAKCEGLSWISKRRFDFASGRHDGYERLTEPATHTRSILFLKNDYWLIRDVLTSDGPHELDLRFHFAAESNPQLEHKNGQLRTILESGENAGLRVVSFGQDGGWSREDGWISHCYGDRLTAPVCVFSVHSEGTTELVTLLIPNAGKGAAKFEVKEVEVIGGRAFEIVAEKHRDLVMLRDLRGSRQVETVRLVSDFDWTWTRFSQNGRDAPEELLGLDGQRLELDGEEILKSAKPISYLMASRLGNKFRLETDEGALDISLPIGDLESLFANANRPTEI